MNNASVCVTRMVSQDGEEFFEIEIVPGGVDGVNLTTLLDILAAKSTNYILSKSSYGSYFLRNLNQPVEDNNQ